MNRLVEIRRELKAAYWVEEGLKRRKAALLAEFLELSEKVKAAAKQRFLTKMNIEPLQENEPNNSKHPRPSFRKH